MERFARRRHFRPYRRSDCILARSNLPWNALLFACLRRRPTECSGRLLKTHEPLPTACEAPVEPFHHQHTLLAEGRNAGVSHGQSIGLQQPQRQPFVVDRRPEVRPPPPIRPSGSWKMLLVSVAPRGASPCPPHRRKAVLSCAPVSKIRKSASGSRPAAKACGETVSIRCRSMSSSNRDTPWTRSKSVITLSSCKI